MTQWCPLQAVTGLGQWLGGLPCPKTCRNYGELPRLGCERLINADLLIPCRFTYLLVSGCRIHLCQKGQASQGARYDTTLFPQLVNYTALACQLCSNQHTTNQSSFREFVMGTYQELKKANPRLPILVRECEGATAKLIARYGTCCT